MKKKYIVSITLAVFGSSAYLLAQAPQPQTQPLPPAKLSPEEIGKKLEEINAKEKELLPEMSYMFGVRSAKMMQRSDLKIDFDQFVDGHKEVFDGKDPKFSEEQIRANMEKFGKIQQEKNTILSQQNESKGKEYLSENAKKDGVKSTESGLQYEVIKEGEGDKPTDSDRVEVLYKGTLIDGTVFDETVDGKSRTFPVRGVIRGWTEGLKLMSKGSKFKFHIPSKLAYGPQPRPGIPGNSTLVFDVELLNVIKGAKPPTAVTPPVSVKIPEKKKTEDKPKEAKKENKDSTKEKK